MPNYIDGKKTKKKPEGMYSGVDWNAVVGPMMEEFRRNPEAYLPPAPISPDMIGGGQAHLDRYGRQLMQRPMQQDVLVPPPARTPNLPSSGPNYPPLSVEDPRVWQGLQIPEDPRMAVPVPGQRPELYVDRFYGVPPYMGPMPDMGPDFPSMVSRMMPVPRQSSTDVRRR